MFTGKITFYFIELDFKTFPLEEPQHAVLSVQKQHIKFNLAARFTRVFSYLAFISCVHNFEGAEETKV